MEKLAPQLTLGLRLQDQATFQNFYPAKNAHIIADLKKTVRGTGERIIYLCGTRGQGLSHLLQACCYEAHQCKRTSIYLPLANLASHTPDILLGFEAMSLICIDDLHAISGKANWEEALFHLYNRAYDNGSNIIIAAHGLPKTLQIGLLDLVSRLSWGIVFQLVSMNDEDKLNALKLRATERGINLSEDTAKYILTHCPRHMATLFAALDVLDKASLAAQRKLTIPFVKEILEI